MAVLQPYVVHEYPVGFQKGTDGGQNEMDVSHDALEMQHLQSSIINFKVSNKKQFFLQKNVQ